MPKKKEGVVLSWTRGVFLGGRGRGAAMKRFPDDSATSEGEKKTDPLLRRGSRPLRGQERRRRRSLFVAPCRPSCRETTKWQEDQLARRGPSPVIPFHVMRKGGKAGNEREGKWLTG